MSSVFLLQFGRGHVLSGSQTPFAALRLSPNLGAGRPLGMACPGTARPSYMVESNADLEQHLNSRPRSFKARSTV